MAVEPSVPVRKLVIIEDGMLIGLSNNHQFVKAFPFLAPLATLTKARAGGCGKCNSAAKRRIQLVNAAKMAVIGLDQSKKDQMKKLMNADRIQVKYRAGKEVKTHEF